MAHATRPTLDRTASMQKLMLLQSQQEVLQRRLSLQVPIDAPFTTPSPSLSSSPTSTRSSFSWSPESEYPATQPIPTQPGMAHSNHRRHSVDDHQNDDSRKLAEINQQIKATLTELLNTESVRNDSKYRAWIQERLMDAERNIRRNRRHHSSGDREMAASIADHFSPHGSLPTRMTWH
ncbi:hypothetical protein K491DRAFT_700853 [Lophiostoma macrostomum CBS 122681]|uniref:Uncharacterized protein n=1 Tax=Lophiostoma macrostomum CBS 122681 TaxID=1314788 RepID=A0A6A6TR74_9PLEO|nr:hypothetical protein K491DRAFT_700853 [Lophiostoma macrostomum CBS 122681]